VPEELRRAIRPAERLQRVGIGNEAFALKAISDHGPEAYVAEVGEGWCGGTLRLLPLREKVSAKLTDEGSKGLSG